LTATPARTIRLPWTKRSSLLELIHHPIDRGAAAPARADRPRPTRRPAPEAETMTATGHGSMGRRPDTRAGCDTIPVRKRVHHVLSTAIGDADRRCVFLHGYPFDHSQWRPQLDLAGDDTRLILPDLRGHGRSEAPHLPYAMTDFADDIRALIDRLDLDRIVLAGLSMGGYIAMAFADRYAERLAGLVLMSTRADPDSDEGRRGRMEMIARIRAGGAEEIVDDMVARILGEHAVASQITASIREMILNTSLEGLTGSLAGMAARPDSLPALAALACPALVIAGSEDHLAPPACAQAMVAALAGAEYLEVPETGHLAPLEKPEVVNPVLGRFLARCRS
jgi:pimeloyl-ACP methyl ester carboxylesterase